MLEFKLSADNKAREIIRDGVRIGTITWRDTKRIVVNDTFVNFSLDELKQCVHFLETVDQVSKPDLVIENNIVDMKV